MERVEAKVAFFIEKKRRANGRGGYLPREVTAVFTDSGNYKMKDCYAHEGQHGVCAVDWVDEECRPATYDEYKALYDEMTDLVGYDIEVVEAGWWIRKSMDYLKAVDEYYKGERNTRAA